MTGLPDVLARGVGGRNGVYKKYLGDSSLRIYQSGKEKSEEEQVE
jgi:hypothetical protein